VADYSLEKEYETKRFPQVGWGQVFQPFFQKDSLKLVSNILGHAKEIKIDDRAKGGRSTRTFFQEGRWASVYKTLQKGDVVMMQFGHNDSCVFLSIKLVKKELRQ
jgi:lysophospholipase L1-like esterase